MNTTVQQKGLKLTTKVFEELHKSLIKEFRNFYQVSPETLVDYQLYGFNQYDEQLPSIRKLIFERTGKWVNGKYLYNKYREYKNNQKVIRFTREFVFIYFQTLSFNSLNSFLQNSSLSEVDIQAQLSIDKPTTPIIPQKEYYVGYYIGEEGNIINTTLTLSEIELKATWTLIYWKKKDAFSEYLYEGTIQYQQSGMAIVFSNEDTLLDRTSFIGLSYEREIKIKPFLLGVGAGYDRDRQPVVVQTLFQRVNSLEEQRELVKNKDINPIIAQYLGGKRWAAPKQSPQSLLDLSVTSKFASLFTPFITDYQGIFLSDDALFFSVEMSIKDITGNTLLNIAGNPSYEGVLKIQGSGQLIAGQFENSSTQAPLFLSIQLSPIASGLFVGDLLGISANEKNFKGKIYLSQNPTINQQMPLKRGNAFSQQEIKNLPTEILQNLKESSKGYLLDTLLKEDQVSSQSENFFYYLKGQYQVKFLENADEEDGRLLIQEDGKVTLDIDYLQYQGQAMLCEGFILSIYFTTCNGIPHCGQIMARLERKKRRSFSSFEASWFHIDDDFRLETKKLSIHLMK